MTLIRDCACGQDHETMPTETDWDGEKWVEYPLVCVEHKRHAPCRECLWDQSGATTTEEYVAWLRKGE
jgi:hypothetical protein